MELGDIPVLETGAVTHAGSTPVIGTLPLSSKDRMSGYEPEDARSIRVAETIFRLYGNPYSPYVSIYYLRNLPKVEECRKARSASPRVATGAFLYAEKPLSFLPELPYKGKV